MVGQTRACVFNLVNTFVWQNVVNEWFFLFLRPGILRLFRSSSTRYNPVTRLRRITNIMRIIQGLCNAVLWYVLTAFLETFSRLVRRLPDISVFAQTFSSRPGETDMPVRVRYWRKTLRVRSGKTTSGARRNHRYRYVIVMSFPCISVERKTRSTRFSVESGRGILRAQPPNRVENTNCVPPQTDDCRDTFRDEATPGFSN